MRSITMWPYECGVGVCDGMVYWRCAAPDGRALLRWFSPPELAGGERGEVSCVRRLSHPGRRHCAWCRTMSAHATNTNTQAAVFAT
jgi:hypothetical protein